MPETQNEKLTRHIATYLRTPPKVKDSREPERFADRVIACLRQRRDAAKSEKTKGAFPDIRFAAVASPTNPPVWIPSESAKFLALVARTDDLTGNCS